jgi:hypothetical protein
VPGVAVALRQRVVLSPALVALANSLEKVCQCVGSLKLDLIRGTLVAHLRKLRHSRHLVGHLDSPYLARVLVALAKWAVFGDMPGRCHNHAAQPINDLLSAEFGARNWGSKPSNPEGSKRRLTFVLRTLIGQNKA